MRIAWSGVLLAVVGASVGCVQLPLLGGNAPAPPPPPPVRPARPADITPENVNKENAREQAEALQRELDADRDESPAAKAP